MSPRAASLLTRNAPEFSVIPPLKVLVPVRNNCPVPDMVNPDVPARADAIVELPAPRTVGAVPPSVSALPVNVQLWPLQVRSWTVIGTPKVTVTAVPAKIDLSSAALLQAVL